jgi:hypothetical protein
VLYEKDSDGIVYKSVLLKQLMKQQVKRL